MYPPPLHTIIYLILHITTIPITADNNIKQPNNTMTKDNNNKISFISPPPLPPAIHTRLTYKLSSLLPRLALPLSLLCGAAIAASGTYGVARYVIHLRAVASDQVNTDPVHWTGLARKVYDACYFSCGREIADGGWCADPSFAWDACVRIRKGTEGVVGREGGGLQCDAVKMWNWEERERYPGVCVEGLGEVMKAEVVGRVQWRALDWCALVVVTVLAGVVGGVGVLVGVEEGEWFISFLFPFFLLPKLCIPLFCLGFFIGREEFQLTDSTDHQVLYAEGGQAER